MPACLTALAVAAGPGSPTATETEPNNSRTTANAIAIGDTVFGAISAETDLDYFAFTAVTGEIVSVDLDSAAGWSPSLAYLVLHRGTVILASPEGILGERALDPHFVFQAPATDTYHVGIAGDAAMGYRLRLTSQAVTEVEPNGTAATAMPLGLSDTVTGVLTTNDLDLFAVTVPAGVLLEATVRVGPTADFWLRGPDGALGRRALPPMAARS